MPTRTKLFAYLLPALLTISSTDAWSSVASDIMAMTGNARAKLAWIRFPWCDSSFNPIQAYATKNNENSNRHTQLVVFDTDEGVERYLDQPVSQHLIPRFTRKDGNYVIWSDSVNTCAWIRDFAGSTAKRKLLDGGDYQVVHCRYDTATDREYVYTLALDRKRLSMVPLKSDYTADLAARTTVYNASAMMKNVLGVSADGRYLGTLMPWPETKIIDMQSGTTYDRHDGSDAFGCQPNMAPDNSYRFCYLRSDHDVLRMWGPGLSTDNWDVRIDKMPGNQVFFGDLDHDCIFPRWSNHPRFFTNGFPLVIWNYANGAYSMNSAQMRSNQQSDSCGAGVFCLGKFAADYKSVEQYVRVTTCDVRKRDVVGDAWISDTPSSVDPATRAAVKRPAAVVVQGRRVTASFEGAGALTLTNSQGRVVARAHAKGAAACTIDGLPAGCYVARVAGESGDFSERVAVGR